MAYFVDNDTDQISVVWRDETHPWWGFNAVYKAIRKCKYGRGGDVESFFYDTSTNGYTFFKIHSTNQTLKSLSGLHDTAQLTGDQVTLSRDDRPMVYIRTWNHAMSTLAPEDSRRNRQDWKVWIAEPRIGDRSRAEFYARQIS